MKNILWFSEISNKDTGLVGGKNASLGEMYCQLKPKGVNIPNGFALTSDSYWHYLQHNGIDKKLQALFANFDPKSIVSLQSTGEQARAMILEGSFPEDLEKDILEAYAKLSKEYKSEATDVAVRSSATAEDLKGASFAGQHETFLNITGKEALLQSIKSCMSSLFMDRAIAYREEKGFEHLKIALSCGIIKMVRSDIGSSGIMFTLDTETGFRNVVLINSIFGIGEMIVKGRITPDEFYVFKPTLKEGYKSIIVKNLGRKDKKYIYKKEAGGLDEVAVSKKDQLRFSIDDEDILALARWAVQIEEHYGCPQDLEWAKDGKTGKLFILQSRPETVEAIKDANSYKEYQVLGRPEAIVRGIAVGQKIGIGKVCLIENVSEMGQFQPGEVLVTKMTDPDWVPIMRLASAIITDDGGKTCHAAIVARELGVPCIVGSGNATLILKNEQLVTVDCSESLKGKVYDGKIEFEIKEYKLNELPKLPVKIMVNIGTPEAAFQASFLPQDGVGLAREEFIIAEKIKVHPLALYHYEEITNSKFQITNKLQIPNSKIKKIKKEIDKITMEHKNKRGYFIKELAEGIGQITAAFWPKPVIVRFSDFKTNEYATLLGGELFEPKEENPMLGFRGASRYYDEKYKPAFLMELEAIKRVRDVFGLKNLKVMVPFCRTPEEGRKVLEVMAEAGLEKGKDGLEVFVMCEIPSNIILAEQFLEIFDGMSIGSNDLTQLVLGLDRDNANLAKIGDERNEAVKKMISQIIKLCREKNKYCGICGQAPSDFSEFAQFLMEEGIESISLNSDLVIKTILSLK